MIHGDDGDATDAAGAMVAATRGRSDRGPAARADRPAAATRRLAAGQILAALERQQTTAWTDAAAWRFLAAVVNAFQGCAVTVAMLLAEASVDFELGEAVGTLTCRQLGTRLRGLTGRWIGGYRVGRVKREGGGVLWVVYVRDLHTQPSVADDSGA